MNQERYYFRANLALPFDKAVEAARAALAEEGFGVLTEIDVQATLREKLGEDFRPYVILGACNPPLAFKTLQADSRIGLMLPCNVVVQETEGKVEVSAINPEIAMEPVKVVKVETVACEVARKLKNVIASLETRS